MRSTVAASVLLLAPFAGACLTLPGAGKGPIAVAGETALVTWDAATRTERFVRTATFTGTDGPMAFLVPTPTPPELEALPEFEFDLPFGALNQLRVQVAPRIVERKRPVYRLSEDWDFGLEARASPKSLRSIGTAALLYGGDADDVTVLGQGEVGGYDTAVLRTNDARALLGWLKGHGFASDARLEGWLRPYTEKGWAITAFRFRPKGATYATDPVCLTFRTDRPFFPYREPASANAPATRSLRVFLVAPGRRAGRLEAGAWGTRAEYAGPLNARAGEALADALEMPRAAFRGLWLTSFLDRRPIRPDRELFFDADADARPVEPTPIERVVDDPVVVPKGLAATGVGVPLLGLAAFGARRKGRRGASGEASGSGRRDAGGR